MRDIEQELRACKREKQHLVNEYKSIVEKQEKRIQELEEYFETMLDCLDVILTDEQKGMITDTFEID